MSRYATRDLGGMARVVEHARRNDLARYRAFVDQLHRRSGLSRYDIAERVTRMAGW